MTNGADLVNAALSFRGEPYSTNGGRTSQTSGYKDCSGLVFAALTKCGIQPGGTVSTSLEVWAVNNGGRYISRDEAINTPGAGIAIWGYGSGGHIGISMGGGQVVETPSQEGRKVGVSPFSRNRWTRFFLFPGISYDGQPASAGGGAQDRTLKLGSAGLDVAAWEQALQHGGMYAGAIDGQFGPQLDAAVRQFQARMHLEVDGIIGPRTWAAFHFLESLAGQPAGPPPPAPVDNTLAQLAASLGRAKTKTVAQGSRDQEAIKWVQALLNKKINAGLVIDGSFGPATKAAVLKFQSNLRAYFRRDVTGGVDGIVGPKTWYWLTLP